MVNSDERKRSTVYLVQSLKIAELREVGKLFDNAIYVYDKRKVLAWVEAIIERYNELSPEYQYKFYDKLVRFIQNI